MFVMFTIPKLHAFSTVYKPKSRLTYTTFQSLPVTFRTTKFNIKKFYIVVTWNLCVLYGSRNKQQIFPYTTLTFRRRTKSRLPFAGIIRRLPYSTATAVAQWLRCCATNRTIAGSIPDGVIGIFHWHNPSDRTMALGSTQPLTEMSTRRISWG